MKYFLTRFVKFATVPVIKSIIPLYIIWMSEEGKSLQAIIGEQERDSSVVIGYTFLYIDPFLKAEKSRQINPDILILGTSRTMQFRRSFFNPAFSFYNAGGAVAHIQDFRNFLEYIDLQGGVLIISIDQYFFNPQWENLKVAPCNYEYKHSITTALLQNIFGVYSHIFSGELNISQLVHSHNIGFLAKMTGDGFREDGSYYYRRIVTDPSSCSDYRFRDTYTRIKEGRTRFEYCTSVDGKAVEVLEELLFFCYNHQIKLIAYLPPYAPSVWKLMTVSDEYADKYAYLKKIEKEIRPLFEKYHYPLFDFSDGGAIGSRDAEFIDGFHGSDKTYLRMMVEMARRDKTVGMYFRDTTQLNQLILKYPDINVAP